MELAALLLFSLLHVPGKTADMIVYSNISYVGKSETQGPVERQNLDVYLPEGEGFPVIVWFHGGGLIEHSKEGQREFAIAMTKRGIGVVVPNYRLSPHANFPSYIEDAASATAWVKQNLEKWGGNPKRLFVGGHSAGGYLAAMLAMDNRYLANVGVKPQEIAGYIPVSAQLTTHFTVRQERGLSRNNVIADEAAPLFYCRADTQPMLLIVGDRDFPARLEENAFFLACLNVAKNKNTRMVTIKDRNHQEIRTRMVDPNDEGAAAFLQFINHPVGL